MTTQAANPRDVIIAASVALKNRKARAAYNPDDIKQYARALRTAVAHVGTDKLTDDDRIFLDCAQEPLLYLFPRVGEWEGAQLNELVSRMCDLLNSAASNDNPVHRYEIDEADYFCAESYTQYLQKAPERQEGK